MNKFLLLSILFYLTVPFTINGETAKYLENVRLDPEHGEMNRDGEIDLYFNLPKQSLVKKVYVSVMIGLTDVVIGTTEIQGSKLGYLNNKITIKGSDLYNIIPGPTLSGTYGFQNFYEEPEQADEDNEDNDDEDYEIPEEDSELPDDADNETDDDSDPSQNITDSSKDGVYSFKLVVELNSENEKEEEKTEDIFGEETEEEDNKTATTPSTASTSFKITFDNVPPEAPVSAETEGGDKRIVLKITPPFVKGSVDKYDSVGKYHVTLSGIFKKNESEVEASVSFVANVSQDEYNKVTKVSLSAKDGYELINNDDGLEKYIYTATISAEDIAGNHDPDKWIRINGSAVTTFGFWHQYKAEGGKEEGGFCFIASASFGSYNHDYVKILRNFRDMRLQKLAIGQWFTKQYYSLGHYPGHWIENYPVIKPLIKAVLFPFVLTAWLFTDSTGLVILLLWTIIFLSVFFRKTVKAVLPVIILFTIFATPSELKGIGGEFSFTNSLYYPGKIDNGIESKPFETIGGSKLRYLPSLTFGLQVPLLEDYIRWSFTGGIGYTRFKGTSVRADGEKSLDPTSMHFIPLTGETKIRPAYSFPVWPYASFGLDYVIWWIREKGSTAKEGGTFGFHGSFGVLLSLNWLDRGAAQKLEHASGIKNSALFVHYRLEKINDFGKENSFDLSQNRFEFGIIFEF